MKRGNKRPKEQQQRTPTKRKGVIELTEQDLEQVQGGFQTGSSESASGRR